MDFQPLVSTRRLLPGVAEKPPNGTAVVPVVLPPVRVDAGVRRRWDVVVAKPVSTSSSMLAQSMVGKHCQK
jgi:hypothetical protein